MMYSARQQFTLKNKKHQDIPAQPLQFVSTIYFIGGKQSSVKFELAQYPR
jgi:hypothetical protein